ncbi:MAG: hypothetical protein DRQ54_05330 [Gammaproteobacteria bacterium]|nr:MAG: hypothetical protein DRQ54_05330 [Gammaproteobacteria bacterium]
MSFVPPSIFDESAGQYPQQLNVAQFYLLFDGLRLVRELVALFKMVQRFRGASIAWAGGDVKFQLTSMQLADELARNRYILECFRTTQNDILPLEDWQQLHGDLNFILSNNRARRYLENFDHKTALLK